MTYSATGRWPLTFHLCCFKRVFIKSCQSFHPNPFVTEHSYIAAVMARKYHCSQMSDDLWPWANSSKIYSAHLHAKYEQRLGKKRRVGTSCKQVQPKKKTAQQYINLLSLLLYLSVIFTPNLKTKAFFTQAAIGVNMFITSLTSQLQQIKCHHNYPNKNTMIKRTPYNVDS